MKDKLSWIDTRGKEKRTKGIFYQRYMSPVSVVLHTIVTWDWSQICYLHNGIKLEQSKIKLQLKNNGILFTRQNIKTKLPDNNKKLPPKPL